MSCFGSKVNPFPHLSEEELKDQIKRNKEIDQRIIKDRKIESQTIKILLLGSGGSGKSTFFKQMQILNSGGFTDNQRQYYYRIIHKNILTSALRLIKAADKLEIKCEIKEGEINFLDEQVKQKIRQSKNIGDISEICKQLWKNEGIQKTYKLRHLYHLPESTNYFFDKLSELEDKDYVPNDKDILHSRVKTQGIYETRFVNENKPFNITDVGGQHSQRRKWILCFEGVSAMIFWVNLNAFDTFSDDNPNTYALVESLQIFEELINNKILKDIVPILFFNKMDLFQEKIKEKNINICFPEYKGKQNYQEATKFIQELFCNKMRERRDIYCHFTTATDTDNINKVFKDIKHTALQKLIDMAFDINNY